MNVRKPRENREHVEEAHFDEIAEETGENWWGSTTVAGFARPPRRAQLLTAALDGYVDPNVVELGCATGAFSRYIPEIFPESRLHGIDSITQIDRDRKEKDRTMP